MSNTDGTSALDLANLDTQPVDQSAEYEGASEFYRPPEPGKETIVLLEAPTDDKFYGLTDFETKKEVPGFAFNGHWQIQGGAQDGKEFYAMIDTRREKGRNGSKVEDYVRALAAKGLSVKTATMGDLKNAIQTSFAPVDSRLTWQGDKCPAECGARRLKMKDFPTKQDGKKDHVGLCKCGEKVGARAKIAAIFFEKEA